MASTDEESRRLQALDERRNAGADAWSPSRAREAIRREAARMNWGRTMHEPTRTIEFMERSGGFDDPDLYATAFQGYRGYPAPKV